MKTHLPSIHSSRCDREKKISYYDSNNNNMIGRLTSFFVFRAGLFRARLPNTRNSSNESFGLVLRATISLYSLLLAKPPGIGVQAACIQFCMVEILQLVLALVWTNPHSRMEVDIPSGRVPEIMDESQNAWTKVTMSGIALRMRDLMCSSRNMCRS